MNVEELIHLLGKYNGDAEVVTSHSETIKVSHISNVDGKEFNIKNTPFVFIDGCDYVEEDD